MALWDKIYNIVSDGIYNHDDAASVTEQIVDAMEEYEAKAQAEEAADRRWNEGR